MKIVPLSEAKARLSHYAQACAHEPVVITVNGKPAFELVPLSEEDDLIDRLLADHPRFRSELEERLAKPALSADEALRALKMKAPRPRGRKRRV